MDVGRPIEILDKMIDLARWWETPVGQRYGENFVKSMAGRSKHPLAKDPPTFGLSRAVYLQRSLPYFITDTMVDKIFAFSKGFDTVGFYPDDVPSANGFLWLAKPMYTLDVGGRIQCERAITWEKQDGGVALCFYADKHDEFDETNLALRTEQGEVYSSNPELFLSHIEPISWGEKTLWDFDAEEYAANTIGPFNEIYYPEKVLVSVQEQFNLCRFVLACWEWMGEQLPSRALPNRQIARRLGRSKLDARDVLVIDLQSQAGDHIPPATHQVVQWHYRWRVREHKRHWTDKHGNRRVTTVHSYIKGDAHLPMVERDILFNVRRGRPPVELSSEVKLAKGNR